MGFFINHYDEKTGRRFYPDEREQTVHDKEYKKYKSYGYDDKTADLFGRMAVLNDDSGKKTYSNGPEVGIFESIIMLSKLAILGISLLIIVIFIMFFPIFLLKGDTKSSLKLFMNCLPFMIILFLICQSKIFGKYN